ncbi:hypothetical protein ACA910_021328 [Epithemia clementina (nom. ined.)]
MSEQVNHDYNPSAASGMVKGGFSFDNVHRNAMIEKMLLSENRNVSKQLFQATKTGTTISGCIFDGGVVLGADTRATNGEEVAEKNCKKIHYIAPNIYCVGAGTAADADKTADLISSQLALLRMDTHSQSRVVTAVTMIRQMLFRYQGRIGASYVLGGCDVSGCHLFEIHSHGSTGKMPFTSSGSGGLAAMAVLESSWRDGLTETEAVELVKRSILAGIFNDLGSGSNCDVIVIRTDGTVDMRRGLVTPNSVEPLRNAIQHSGRLIVPPGVTPILNTTYTPHPTSSVLTAETTATEMEVES